VRRFWTSKSYGESGIGNLTLLAQVEMHICKVVIQRAVQSDPRGFRLQTEDGVEVALLIYGLHFPPFDPFDGSGALFSVVPGGNVLFAAVLGECECRCGEEQ
jgi:hypothetical protein